MNPFRRSQNHVSALLLLLFLSFNTNAQQQSETRPRSAAQLPPDATIIISEQFMNAFLDSLFTKLKGPSYPIASTDRRQKSGASANHAACSSVVTLEREKAGVKTAVKIDEGRITSPLAFSGSYDAGLLGCLKFEGWADTTMKLDWDTAKQSLNARVQVREIHLIGVPQLANSVVLGLVQGAIDRRINPVQILPAAQMSMRIPIKESGGTLRLKPREVKPEVVAGFIKLHINFDIELDQ